MFRLAAALTKNPLHGGTDLSQPVCLCCGHQAVLVLTNGGPAVAAEDGNVWSFNFFFYNKKLKRILYFSCRGISKSANKKQESSGYTYNSDDETRYGMANEMDV